ncbi:hypothetical protein F0562_022045 [Nyssa sinensis]|uniref:Uncharacterized protein n=1 Tax=Nyssa sinensis TaxID=561372 RepID=A0A5J5BM53_9ASTE|nr:hypothetical protein F0562_022045 [Nyssa sinensis]
MTFDSHTRRLSSCYRHPAEPVTGFCASCLRERLAGLEPSGHPESSSSTTATASKSLLQNSGGSRADRASHRDKSVASSSSFPLELRRSKSFSVNKCEAFLATSEPRRKSCDVGPRNSLLHLFNLDDERDGLKCEVESKNLGFCRLTGLNFESRGEAESEGKIRVSEDVLGQNGNLNEQTVEEFEGELKTMKEHIDLEWQSRRHAGRDLKDIAGSFWEAASVFSKKLRKWKRKQKINKPGSGNGRSIGEGGDLLARVEKRNGQQLRETQSEAADYGFGRRSCDTDPRFSVDAGRMSLDNPRFSFDEHRASWDGYLIARTIPRLTPMLAAVENMMVAPVSRSDNRVLVGEQMNSINEDETTSGGSAQTKDYCSDSSSSRRRSSFDCSSSVKSSNKKSLALDVDEMKCMLNSKVSPATIDIFHGTKLLMRERNTRDLNRNALKDDQLEIFESTSKNATSVASGSDPNRVKKSSNWLKVWNIRGFIHGLSDNKHGDAGGNAIDQSSTESCQKQGGEADGVEIGASSGRLIRSSSCVGSRSSSKMIGSNHSTTSATETRGCVNKNREEFVLDRNRSVSLPYAQNEFTKKIMLQFKDPFQLTDEEVVARGVKGQWCRAGEGRRRQHGCDHLLGNGRWLELLFKWSTFMAAHGFIVVHGSTWIASHVSASMVYTQWWWQRVDDWPRFLEAVVAGDFLELLLALGCLQVVFHDFDNGCSPRSIMANGWWSGDGVFQRWWLWLSKEFLDTSNGGAAATVLCA